jgi:caffeoyl-CoA O-methyltransferase
MLSHLLRPQRVLEIGTFCGYATLCLAEGLAPDGVVHTIEINPEKEARIRRYVAAAGLDGGCTCTSVPLDILPGTWPMKTWDLVFIDADKRNNDRYFELVIEQVRPGGLLVVDNVLWGGKVLPGYEREAQRQGHPSCGPSTTRWRATRGWKAVFLPLRDGLLLLRKK